MTTTVKRGAGRPAATARSNRHAQRTSLPPRPGDVGEAIDVLKWASQHPDETAPFGKMTIAELKAYAASVGLDHDADGRKITSRTPRDQILNGILNWERNRANREADKAEANVQEATDAEKNRAMFESTKAKTVAERSPDFAQRIVAAGRGARTKTVASPDMAKSVGKAEKFKVTIEGSGWTTSIEPVDGTADSAEARAVRGQEVITIRWDAGVFNYAESSHVIADRVTKVRNVSQARQFAGRPTEVAEQELVRVQTNKAWKRKEPKGPISAPQPLPFDPESVQEAELWEALRGRTVKWRNQYRVEEEIAVVSGNTQAGFRLIGDSGADRVVQFNAVEGGMRAFRLSALSVVGGSARRTRTQKG